MVDKKEVEKLVVENKKSSLKNHWDDSFFYNITKYSGEIRPNEILIWRSSHFLRGAYPIFHLTFDKNGNLKGIKTEKNPFHKLLNKISIGFLILLTLVLFITTDFKLAIIGTLGISLIAFLLNFVLTKSRIYEKKLLTEELKKTLENIEQLKSPGLINKPKTELKRETQKEWTFTKTLTRLLLYPFCALILWVSATEFLPVGKTILGIFGIVVALAYPIADILLVIKKNKNYS